MVYSYSVKPEYVPARNSGCSYVESVAGSPVLVSINSTEVASAIVIISPIFGAFSSMKYSPFSSLFVINAIYLLLRSLSSETSPSQTSSLSIRYSSIPSIKQSI